MMNLPAGDTTHPYSSRILKIFLEFLQNDHPHINPDAVLAKSGLKPYTINDPSHWLTQEEVDRFYKVVCEQTGESDIARRAGRFASSKGLGNAKQYILGFMTPTAIFLLFEKVYPLFSLGADIAARKIESNVFEIIATPKPGVAEKPYQCENRTGFFEAVPKLFSEQYGVIDHPQCCHKGDSCCRYIITWQDSSLFFWKRVHKYFLAASAVISGALFFPLPVGTWGMGVLALALINALLAYYFEKMNNKCLVETVQNQKNENSVASTRNLAKDGRGRTS